MRADGISFDKSGGYNVIMPKLAYAIGFSVETDKTFLEAPFAVFSDGEVICNKVRTGYTSQKITTELEYLCSVQCRISNCGTLFRL